MYVCGQVSAVLDAKGGGRKGRYQAKAKKMSAKEDAIALIRSDLGL
jgi:hypothetical protein